MEGYYLKIGMWRREVETSKTSVIGNLTCFFVPFYLGSCVKQVIYSQLRIDIMHRYITFEIRMSQYRIFLTPPPTRCNTNLPVNTYGNARPLFSTMRIIFAERSPTSPASQHSFYTIVPSSNTSASKSS